MSSYFNPLIKTTIMQTQGIKDLAKSNSRFKAELIIAIGRFLGKDWGEVTPYDIYLNNKALHKYEFIRAEYGTHKETVVIVAFPNEFHNSFNNIVIMLESEEDSVCLSA